MEVELKKETVFCYETIAETTMTQEETLEAIVPDACPDILRMADVCGQVVMTGKQAEDGYAMVEGTILTTLLYQPDQGTGLRRMEVAMPFRSKLEIPGLMPTGILQAHTHLHRAEARILNPRKVLVRAEIVLRLAAFQPTEHIISSGLLEPERDQICQKQVEVEYCPLCCVTERAFPFSDEIRFQHGGGVIPTVLAYRIQPNCMESRLIGTKLIFKGAIELELLFADGDGVLSQRHESLPFSQILETPEAEEQSECQVSVVLTGAKCEIDPEDDTRFFIELELLAQAQVRCRKTMVVLSDCYSTTHEMETISDDMPFCQSFERIVCPQNVRELLETEELVRSVADQRIQFGSITQQREGNRLTLLGKAILTILYLDEEQQLQSIQKEIELSGSLDCTQETICSDCHMTAGEMFALPAAGGIELRLSVEFHGWLTRRGMIRFTASGQLGAPRSREGVRPSVVLRLASSHESLWDIAKVYGTTTQRILQANELEDETALKGRMLLIPSGR